MKETDSQASARRLTKEQVCAAELRFVEKRRQAIQQTATEQTDRQDQQADEIKGSLVGLAFSGGGVRSGAFNLGFAQALYESNVLQNVDYLSTVSGGGYAGGHLSSQVCHPDAQYEFQSVQKTDSSLRNPKSQDDEPSKVGGRDAKSGDCDFENPVDKSLGAGRRSIEYASRIKEIARSCRHLCKPGVFFNRQLLGSLLLLTVTFSGLSTCAALLSVAFRSLDGNQVSHWIGSMGFRGDVWRAFLPATALGACWFFIYMGTLTNHRWSTGFSQAARVLLWLTVGASLCGIALVAGTGDIALVSHRDVGQIGQEGESTISAIAKRSAFGMGLAIATALLPYLQPQMLIRSATAKKSGISRLIYRAASVALLFGIPLVLFWYFSRENISNYEQTRVSAIPGLSADTSDNGKSADTGETAASGKTTDSGKTEDNSRAGDTTKNLVTSQATVSDKSSDSRLTAEEIKTHLKQFTAHASPDIPLAAIKEWTAFWDFVEVRNDSDQYDLLSDPEQRDLLPPKLAERLISPPKEDDTASSTVAINEHTVRLQRSRQSFARLRDYHKGKLILHRMGLALGTLLGGTQYKTQVERSRAFQKDCEYVLKNVNEQLADPRLYHCLERKDSNTPEGTKQTAQTVLDTLSELAAKGNSSEMHVARIQRLKHLVKEAVLLEEQFDEMVHTVSTTPAQTKFTATVYGAAIREVFDSNDDLETKQQRTLKIVAIYDQIRRNNRTMFDEFFCPSYVLRQGTVFAYVCQESDQGTRLEIAMICGSIFLVLGWLISLNSISLQDVYRDAIADAWLVDSSNDSGRRIELSQLLVAVERGFPYHIINCTVTVGFDWDEESRPDRFIFSPLYSGTDAIGWIRSDHYAKNDILLPEAVALSGAAVSPPQISDLLGKTLLILGNFRMGQWIPNPNFARWTVSLDDLRPINRLWISAWRKFPPSPLRMILHALAVRWLIKPTGEPFVSVSDGGHYENLGIEALVKRRCRLIIASDATADPNYEFEDAAKSFGIISPNARLHPISSNSQPIRDSEFREFDLLKPQCEKGLSAAHWVIFRIEYLDDDGNVEPQDGYLIYVKPILTGDATESFDLQHRSQTSAFPQDPTSDQVYDDAKFDSYRRLGFHIGMELSRAYDRTTHGKHFADSFIKSLNIDFEKSSASQHHDESSFEARELDEFQSEWADTSADHPVTPLLHQSEWIIAPPMGDGHQQTATMMEPETLAETSSSCESAKFRKKPR